MSRLLDTLVQADPRQELDAVSLGDKRLTKRCEQIARSVLCDPAASFPRLVANDSELAGAYRFFNNSKVAPEKLLAPHAQRTVERAGGLRTVLAIHDSTDVTFSGSRRGLGATSGGQQGFIAHVSLLATADERALPLGVLGVEFIKRKPGVKKGRKPKYSLDDDNEGARWERGVSRVEEQLRGVSPVHLEDRDGDSFLLFARMIEEKRRFVVRLTHNRALAAEGDAPRRLFDAVAELPVRHERTVRLSKRATKTPPKTARQHPPRLERLAHLNLSATRLSLKRPHAAPAALPPKLDVNIVRVSEPLPPEGVHPVEWLLVTSEPIETPQDVIQVVDFYRRRWLIEEFFKALKSGCSIEKREFEDVTALQNVFVFMLPFAWQMLLLRTLARQEPSPPASLALTDTQLQVLHLATRRLPPRQRPPENPDARQALLAIAALGGHLTRNGEPGWSLIAGGFDSLRHLDLGFRLQRGAP